MGIKDIIYLVAECVIAVCAIVTVVYTAVVNNSTTKEARKMAELKYRQLIIDANNTFITLSKDTSGSGAPAVNSALEQLLNAYEVICFLKKDEILTEDFKVLYGNEMLQIINVPRIKQKIDKSGDDFKYIKDAKNLLENKK